MIIGIICPGYYLESWQADWLSRIQEENSFQFILLETLVKDPAPAIVRRFLPLVNIKDRRILPFVENEVQTDAKIDLYINFTTDKTIEKTGASVIHIDFLLTSWSSLLLPLQLQSSVTTIQLFRTENGKSFICSEGTFRTAKHSIEKHLKLNTDQATTLLTDYIFRQQKEEGRSADLPGPSTINSVAMGRKVFAAGINHTLNKLFTSYRWNVGIVKTDPADLLDSPSLHTINWMKEENGREFNADPFLQVTENGVRIFFEHLLEGVKGVICKAEYNNQVFSSYKWVLEKNRHLSYPFTFQYNNKNYIMPESAGDNEVKVHEVDDNGEITNGKVIISNFDVVDPTLVQWNDKWWLFCTRKKNKSPDLRLYIFYADDLFGKWNSHAMNPVKCDIRNSRPGGMMFTHQNKLYRPAQDSSDTYGGRVVINEVTELTGSTFSEKPVAYVEPKQFGSRYKDGIHTISFANGYMAVDGKRSVISLFSI